MLKATWVYVLFAAAIGVGGLTYVLYQCMNVNVVVAPAKGEVIVPSPNASNKDLNKQRAAGIGSIRDLKPVPIPSASSQARH